MPLYKDSFVSRDKLIHLVSIGNVHYFLRHDAVGIYSCVDGVLKDEVFHHLPVPVIDLAERKFGYYDMAPNQSEQ